MKDFKQISEENHISRQTIYNRIAKIPDFKKKHLTKKNGKWYVDNSGVNLLNFPKKPARPKHYKRRNGLVKQDYIQEVQVLKKKLSQRDRVITNLSYSFKKLANQSKPNERQLMGQKSELQPKLEHYNPRDDEYEQKIFKLNHDKQKLQHKLKARPIKHESFWQWIFKGLRK